MFDKIFDNNQENNLIHKFFGIFDENLGKYFKIEYDKDNIIFFYLNDIDNCPQFECFHFYGKGFAVNKDEDGEYYVIDLPIVKSHNNNTEHYYAMNYCKFNKGTNIEFISEHEFIELRNKYKNLAKEGIEDYKQLKEELQIIKEQVYNGLKKENELLEKINKINENNPQPIIDKIKSYKGKYIKYDDNNITFYSKIDSIFFNDINNIFTIIEIRFYSYGKINELPTIVIQRNSRTFSIADYELYVESNIHNLQEISKEEYNLKLDELIYIYKDNLYGCCKLLNGNT